MSDQQPLPAKAVVVSLLTPLPTIVEDSLSATLARMRDAIVAIPPEKRGQARLTINLEGVGADVAARLSEHVTAAARVAHAWQSGTSAQGAIIIEWAPEP